MHFRIDSWSVVWLNTSEEHLDTMKAVTLITMLVGSVALSSCCCQSQPAPPLRPMPKDLVKDTPQAPYVEPVKVFTQKGK